MSSTRAAFVSRRFTRAYSRVHGDGEDALIELVSKGMKTMNMGESPPRPKRAALGVVRGEGMKLVIVARSAMCIEKRIFEAAATTAAKAYLTGERSRK